jgi:hypothetical protein
VDSFAPFFGSAPPLVVIGVALVVGAVCLAFVLPREGFEAFAREKVARGSAMAAAIATGFGALIVVIDLVFPLPVDINVPLPRALWFYPVMGLVAEVVFHLVPLSLVLIAMRPLSGYLSEGRRAWVAIAAAALIEPAFQAAFTTGMTPMGTAVITLHVLGINASQLFVFKRFDFVSAFVLRLVYYLWWHIFWGTLRLGPL